MVYWLSTMCMNIFFEGSHYQAYEQLLTFKMLLVKVRVHNFFFFFAFKL